MKRLPPHLHPWFAKRVLEVGGGHDPYVGVTHAVDMMPGDDSQRGGALRLAKGVEFREGVLEDIPFKDVPKFDFFYLSHVMEHTPSPQKAVEEINRVADRGYIETPSPVREQITCPRPFNPSKDFHLHFIWKSALAPNTIAFIRKSAKTVNEFSPSKEGQFARVLCELAQEKNLREFWEIEALLPSSAKCSPIYFAGPLKVIEYSSFREAYDKGDDAYRSVAKVFRAMSFPLLLASSRFRKLRRLARGRL